MLEAICKLSGNREKGMTCILPSIKCSSVPQVNMASSVWRTWSTRSTQSVKGSEPPTISCCLSSCQWLVTPPGTRQGSWRTWETLGSVAQTLIPLSDNWTEEKHTKRTFSSTFGGALNQGANLGREAHGFHPAHPYSCYRRKTRKMLSFAFTVLSVMCSWLKMPCASTLEWWKQTQRLLSQNK